MLKIPFQIFCFLTILLISPVIFAQSIAYDLSMPNPEKHLFHVKMTLKGFKDDQIKVKLPVWAPGSYMVREFSKNINLVRAKNEKEQMLDVNKEDKNTWVIKKSKSESVTVIYEVYAFDLTVRTSFLDHTHGYLNGTSVFMYVDGFKNLSGKLTITPHPTFRDVATSLKPLAEGVQGDGTIKAFEFPTYDELVDSPIEIGNLERFSFMAGGVKHDVAIYGEGNYDIEKMKVDMARICESTQKVFGNLPIDRYLFIIHNTEKGGGGLEHLFSTTLNVDRFSYHGPRYLGFLSLVAHEYFHLWNVKRLRPIELGPFDYDKENYTSLLWVMEGFTSYYDELLLRRANFYTKEQYLDKLFATINSVENQPGNKVQPVAHSSFDAWIKLYHPNENSYNTTISYYSKGQLIGAVLDAMLISSSNGKKNLDDFMNFLFNKYYIKEKRGFKEDEFKQDLEKYMNRNLDDFFEKYINGTEELEYAKALEGVGVQVVRKTALSPFFGTSLSENNGKLTVKRVQSNSAAERAKISAGDEIIAINGFRTDQAGFNDFIGRIAVGEAFEILISRDGKIMKLDAQMGEMERVNFQYVLKTDEESKRLNDIWLKNL